MQFTLPGNRGNLYVSVLIANIASLAIGTHYTWSSPSIPKLQEADSWLPVDDNQASWLGSLTALGTVFGPWLAGLLVNVIGRRRTIMVAVLINLVAWIEVLVSRNVWEIYIGRLLGGLGGGVAFVACPLYVAEISEVPVRGALGSLFALFLIAGYVVEYAVGPYVSYTALIIVNMIPAVIFFLLIPFIPESPYFFLKKDDDTGALQSLRWLRTGRSIEEVQMEVYNIKEEIRISMKNQARLSDLFTVRKNWMGLIISGGAFLGQQIVGTNVILFYAQEIFISAHTQLSSSASTIVFGLVLLCFRATAAPLVRAFGMKKILIGSATGTAIFMFILGTYFYLDASVVDISAYGWVPILTLVCYTVCQTVGFGPLPWATMGEVFSPEVKAQASSLCASFNWLVSFLFTRYFKVVGETLGSCAPYFLFSVGGVLALLFVIFVFPDTRGMTLKEVTDMLDGKPRANKSFSEKT